MTGTDAGPPEERTRRATARCDDRCLPARAPDRPRRDGRRVPGARHRAGSQRSPLSCSRPGWPMTGASASASCANRGWRRRSTIPRSCRSTTPARSTARSTSRCGTSTARTCAVCSRADRSRPPGRRDPVAGRLGARCGPSPRPRPSRRQARQHPARRRGARVPVRLRPHPARVVAVGPHGRRRARRHRGVRRPGADRGARRRRPRGRLLARVRAVRVLDGAQALRPRAGHGGALGARERASAEHRRRRDRRRAGHGAREVAGRPLRHRRRVPRRGRPGARRVERRARRPARTAAAPAVARSGRRRRDPGGCGGGRGGVGPPGRGWRRGRGGVQLGGRHRPRQRQGHRRRPCRHVSREPSPSATARSGSATSATARSRGSGPPRGRPRRSGCRARRPGSRCRRTASGPRRAIRRRPRCTRSIRSTSASWRPPASHRPPRSVTTTGSGPSPRAEAMSGRPTWTRPPCGSIRPRAR